MSFLNKRLQVDVPEDYSVTQRGSILLFLDHIPTVISHACSV